MRCCTVLQDPSTLYWGEPIGSEPFQVVAASYGHPRDPKLAFDVRPQLQGRVVRGGERNILTSEINASFCRNLWTEFSLIIWLSVG